MNNDNMEMIQETVETGMEVATEVANVAKSNDGLKKVGIGAGLLVAGALACKGIELAINFGKSKLEERKQKKNETKTKKAEVSEEKTESVEN